jgi:DNA-binding MarR family transcriptional regulator
MSKTNEAAFETTERVRDTCLCLHAQRAARKLARRFDDVLRPVGLTSGQFSILNSLNRPEPAGMGAVASFLGLDRTTLTAALKPLERQGLVQISIDPRDRRGRLMTLTPAGQAQLSAATPLWAREHALLSELLAEREADSLRRDLLALS